MAGKYTSFNLKFKLVLSNSWDKRIKPLEIELTKDEFNAVKRKFNEVNWE